MRLNIPVSLLNTYLGHPALFRGELPNGSRVVPGRNKPASVSKRVFCYLRKMKKILLAAVVAAFFVSTAADARGGRGFSGSRSFSRPAPARTYAPKRSTVVKKNTTVINQTVTQTSTSSGGGFWSTVAGAAAGSMAGNAIYDVMTKDDEPKQPAQAPQQPQVIYVPVDQNGKPVQQAQ